MTPFDWDEFLELAEEMVNRRGNPAAERAAISRAYYAVYHRAKDYYIAQGQPVRFAAEDHRSVAVWFQSASDLGLRKIGTHLARLLQARRVADYEPVFRDLTPKSQEAVTVARTLINALSKLT